MCPESFAILKTACQKCTIQCQVRNEHLTASTSISPHFPLKKIWKPYTGPAAELLIWSKIKWPPEIWVLMILLQKLAKGWRRRRITTYRPALPIDTKNCVDCWRRRKTTYRHALFIKVKKIVDFWRWLMRMMMMRMKRKMTYKPVLLTLVTLLVI